MSLRSIWMASVSLGILCVTAAYVGAVEDTPQRSEFPTDGVQVTTTVSDCPVDVVDAVSGDFEAVTLSFSDNLLTPERRSLHCRIGIDYQFQAGWRFWRPATVARGFHNLVNGRQRAVWVVRTRLNGGAWGSEPPLVAQGPVTDYFQKDGQDGEVWGEAPTACGATSAHIDVEIIGSLFFGPVDDTTASTISTIDSIDTEIDWQRCN